MNTKTEKPKFFGKKNPKTDLKIAKTAKSKISMPPSLKRVTSKQHYLGRTRKIYLFVDVYLEVQESNRFQSGSLNSKQDIYIYFSINIAKWRSTQKPTIVVLDIEFSKPPCIETTEMWHGFILNSLSIHQALKAFTTGQGKCKIKRRPFLVFIIF